VTRLARTAHAKTSESDIPGAVFRTQTTSLPARESVSTAALGKLSSARTRIKPWERPARSAEHPAHSEAGRDVFARQAGIIREDVSFAPGIGHQANDELD